MAKYYLGKSVEGIYQPILLAELSTSIKDIIEFTTGYPNEMELREDLLSRKLIKYYDDELAYVKEVKQGDSFTYQPLLLGHMICTIESKQFFDPVRIRAYCLSECSNSELYAKLAKHYMTKLKVTTNIHTLIMNLSMNKYALDDFLKKCMTLSSKTTKAAENLYQHKDELNYEEQERYLWDILTAIYDNDDDLIAIYYYFKNRLDTNYTTPIDKAIRVYSMIKKAKSYQQEISDIDLRTIKEMINQLIDSIIQRYDSGTKDYKKDTKGYIMFERNIVDLGLFLSSYAAYVRETKRSTREVQLIDGDHEDFLEEEDFKRMHTTSEREGFTLRKSEHN